MRPLVLSPALTLTLFVAATSILPDPARAQIVAGPGDARRMLLVVEGEPEPDEAVQLEKLDLRVVIRGLLAETTSTMTFFNPSARALSAELVFPLPEGATVSGYGLDVAGQMVDGVVVEKHKARIAFEKEVRKGIDPGLIEWVAGNVFKTRIYPVPAKGRRTVKVQYTSELSGSARMPTLQVPLNLQQRLKEFHLKVEVVRGPAPRVVAGGFADFEFEQWEDRFVAETTRKDIELAADLHIALPDMSTRSVVIEREGSADAVFVVHDQPEAHSAPPEASPRRVGMVWDASLSRHGLGRETEYALLEELAKAWEVVTLDVRLLRDRVEEPRSFVMRGDARELIAWLREVPYDGGTALGALRFPASHAGQDYDLHLVFADGHGNIGARLPTASPVRVFTIASSSTADHALLRAISEHSGGSHINLARTTVADATARFASDPFSFLGLEVRSGDVSDIQPTRRQPVSGRFAVTGRLHSAEAVVVLRYGFRERVVQEVPITLRQRDVSETGLVARYWAQRSIADLAVLPAENREKLLDLGRRYGLVTPGTSLLVLETLEQYVEHDVTPPESRPALLARFLEREAGEALDRDRSAKQRLEGLVAKWQARVAWWKRDFSDWQTRLDKKNPDEPAPDLASALSAVLAFDSAQGPVLARVAREQPMAEDAGLLGSAQADFEQRSKADASGLRASGASIEVAAWNPDTPYLAALREAGPAAYSRYLSQRDAYGSSPAYFLDCATFFFRADDSKLGRRVLTAILELGLEEPSLLRVVAYRLDEARDYDLAVEILEQVARLRPEEPQSLRDLALVLSKRGELPERGSSAPGSAADDMSRSMHLLHRVTLRGWDRFDEIELIALMELNRQLDVVERMPAKSRSLVTRPDLDERLRTSMPVGIRILLSWDADMTDVDLWVIEPSGQKAFYAKRLSAMGGAVSRDFTQGYGPEEYCLKTVVPGSYKIQANYYGSRQQTLVGAATLKATIFVDYGLPSEHRQELTLRLGDVKEVVEVGRVHLE